LGDRTRIAQEGAAVSIAAYPAWPVRLERSDGTGIDIPSNALEWETRQELRVAFSQIPLVDYAVDHLGTRRAPRGLAEEVIRFIAVHPDAQGLEDWLKQLRGFVVSLSVGKLWVRDATGTLYWALVRPTALPEMTYGIEQMRIMPVSLRLQRVSDWYAARERKLTRVVRSSPDNTIVTSQGTVETRKLVLALRPEPIQSGLTVSGTVITDALRSQTTPAHFDGRQPESSIGIWRGTTNLVTNGSFETNTNGWVGSGATISRNTTRSVHGIACLQVVTNGGSSDQGTTTPTGTSGIPVTAGGSYTASAWVSGNAPLRINIVWYNASGTSIGGSASAFTTPGSSWIRLVSSGVAPASAAYAAVRVETSSTTSVTFYVDAVQFENLPFPTPYVHTDGATASRSGGNLILPAPVINALLDEAQGWVAMRFRPSLSPSQLPSGYSMYLFSWQNASTGPLITVRLGLGGTDNQFLLASSPGGSVGLTPSVTPGQSYTVIAAWTSSQVKLSWNGSAFVTGTRSGIPDLSTIQANLGQQWNTDSQRALNGEFLWVAMGTGTLTDTDAAALAALGDTDPTPADFPAAAQLTALWNCTVIGTSIVRPKVETVNSARWIQSLRTLNNWQQCIELDVLNYRVRYSADGGQTWSNDWPNIALGPAQADLLLLTPGDNLVVVTLDPTSVNPALWIDLRWYDAFA
jgi:hypothetical protein